MSSQQRTKLEQLIRNSSLISTQQEEFISALQILDDFWLQPILQLIKEHPDVILSLYKNLKAKKVAIASGDSRVWEKIMADEDEWLQRLDKKIIASKTSFR